MIHYARVPRWHNQTYRAHEGTKKSEGMPIRGQTCTGEWGGWAPSEAGLCYGPPPNGQKVPIRILNFREQLFGSDGKDQRLWRVQRPSG